MTQTQTQTQTMNAEETKTTGTTSPSTNPERPSWRRQIDVIRIKAELRQLTEEIRAKKLEIRRTPLPWPRPLYSELRTLKARATLLCAIQAHRRGRLHLRRCLRAHAYLGLPQTERFTIERQGRFIGDRWREFELGGGA